MEYKTQFFFFLSKHYKKKFGFEGHNLFQVAIIVHPMKSLQVQQ